MQYTILPKSDARISGRNIRQKTEPGRSVLVRELSCTAPEGVLAVRLLNASLWLIAIVLVLAVSLPGQETTGTITGVVTDPSGALLANAEITATNTGTGATFRAASNSAGDYVFRTLPVGAYRLTATAPGFKRFEASNVLTQVNEVTRVDIGMLIGDVAESVEVTAPRGERQHARTPRCARWWTSGAWRTCR